MNSFAGKVAVITGGSRGIGKSIVVALAKAQAKVVINYQGNEKAAKDTLMNVNSMGGEGFIVKADVSISKDVDLMIKEVINRYGRIDILVNNAGITSDNLLLRMKDEEWDKVINTNLTGVFNCVRAVSKPMMKQRYGKIINISSVVGIMGNAGQVNYSSAKAGIIGLTKSVARELASRGIMVNAIAPGYIITDMTDEISDSMKEQLKDRIPIGRLGNPEDVANLVIFLAGSGSDYITGQVISVDGGMNM